MAEVINEIIGKEAFAQIERMEKGLNGLVDTFVKSANAAKLLEDALGDAKGVKGTTQGLSELEKYQKQMEAQVLKLAFAERELGKQRAKNAVELEQQNAINKTAAREVLAAEGSINQMSASLVKWRREYDAMSKAMRESPMGAEMVKRIQATDAALKQLDGSTGRFQRNVGDYKNQLFGLTQVFRELPGFTYSAQTGILGLSNNLPILADGFKAVAAATNETTGKVNGTMGAMKIFASSIFSFGNIFAIAIGLFTIFSKEIFAMIGSTEKAATSQDLLNKAIENAEYKKAAHDVNELRINIDLAKEGFLDKKTVVDQYNKTLGDTLGRVTTLDEAEKMLVKNGDAYIQMTLLKAAANLALDEAGKKYVEAEMTRQRRMKDFNEANKPGGGGIGGSWDDIKDWASGRGRGVVAIGNQVNEIKKEGDEFTEIAKKFQKDAAIIAKSLGGSVSGGGTSASGKTKGNIGKGTKEDRAKEIKEYEHDLFQLDLEVQQMNEKTDEATKKRILDRLEWIRKKNEEYAKMELDAIKEGMAGNQALLDSEDAQIEEMWRKRIERVQEYANIVSTATELMGNITEIIYNAEISKINERERVLNDNYDAETKRINASFTNKADRERELIKLQAQREAQQKNIDQARRRAERKAAQQNKAYSIAQIIMDTAVSVMKTFSKYGFTPLGIGLAAAQGAIGIANIARVASTPLPEYYKGTDNHPGGLAHVGEKGVELGILPGGKTFLTPATDTIMDLPAQTKIIPHEKLMQSVYNVAFKKLGNGNKVSTDSMQTAMLEAFSELTNDVKELKKVMINKNSNVNIIGNFDHYMHVKKNIR